MGDRMTPANDYLHDISGRAAPCREPVAPERVIDGAPTTETILDYERGALFAGEWAADVGAWRVVYDEWEFCHMLSGVCEVTPDGGDPRIYRAGDSFVIEPGFKGEWRVLEPMRKKFVVQSRG